MPRNSSGQYTLPAKNPVSSNTLIESGWANPTMTDLGTSLSDSLDRYGRGTMLAALKLIDGAVNAPALAFNAEASTGLYRAGTHDVRLAIGGLDVAKFTDTSVTLVQPLTVSGGIAGNVTMTGGLTVPDNQGITWGDGSTKLIANSTTDIATLTAVDFQVGAGMTVHGNPNVSRTQSGVAVGVGGGTFPAVGWIRSDLGADLKTWDAIADSDGGWKVRAVNDANNAATVALAIGRTGTTIANVAIPNTANIYFGYTLAALQGHLQLQRNDATAGNTNNDIVFTNRGSVANHTTVYDVGGVFASAYRDILDPAYIAGISFERGSASGGNASLGSIVFRTDSVGTSRTGIAERMRIDPNGLVGIGTAPISTAKLVIQGGNMLGVSVVGNTTAQTTADIAAMRTGTDSFNLGQGACIQLGNSTSNLLSLIQSAGAATQFFNYNGTWIERMRLDANGWLGINITPTSYSTAAGPCLQIRAASPSYASNIVALSAAVDCWLSIWSGLTASDGASLIYPSTSFLRFGTTTNPGTNGYVERARFTGGGAFCIAGSAPANTEILSVRHPASTTEGMRLTSTVAGANSTIVTNRLDTQGYALAFLINGNVVGSITHPNASATAFNTTSDLRLKENIAPSSEDFGAIIDGLQLVQYDWIVDQHHVRASFIAQDLVNIIPEAVHEGGDDPALNPWSIDVSRIVPFLVGELQSLRQRIAKLETLQ